MDLLDEYRRRAETRRSGAERLDRVDRALSAIRLVVFAAAAALVWLAVDRRALSLAWTLLPLAAFLALVVYHDAVIKRRLRLRRAERHYERGIARLEDRWIGQGPTGDRFLDPDHPYAGDLDLFGSGSLFQRISDARTRAGEATLASWLLGPAEADEVRARQGAVRELAPLLDLRETLALEGEEVEVGVLPEAMVRWAQEPAHLASAYQRRLALVLGLLGLAGLVAWLLWHSGFTPLLAILLLQGTFRLRLQAQVLRVWHGADHPTRDLKLLRGLLGVLERSEFRDARLVALRARLASDGLPPSRLIARLDRYVDLLDRMRNPLFAPLGFALLWDFQFAFAIEAWRRRHGAKVEAWLHVVGEFEALASVAGYAREEEDAIFPELLSGDANSTVLEAEALGHPLLPRGACVRNDIRLDGETRFYIVSGSNMSGKSTWLRTIGTCVVLAMAGAPVRARSCRLRPVRVGASIRNQDSLQAGRSRFFAEIRRLRQIVELIDGSMPVLVLADEILNGTNSKDRGLGAAALVEEWLERGAVGLLTTHDLSLTRLADGPRRELRNVHFEDRLEAGELHFDYRLRDGVVERSNALALMRAVGLRV